MNVKICDAAIISLACHMPPGNDLEMLMYSSRWLGAIMENTESATDEVGPEHVKEHNSCPLRANTTFVSSEVQLIPIVSSR